MVYILQIALWHPYTAQATFISSKDSTGPQMASLLLIVPWSLLSQIQIWQLQQHAR